MAKTAVIYWSATGNTEKMAQAIFSGISGAGAQAELFSLSEFAVKNIDDYEKIAFGCPSMGAEVLEEVEFEPFFASIEKQLPNKKIALFGSFGWGDGEWMRDWQERVKESSALLFEEGLIVNLEPGAADIANCEKFGKRFAES